MRTDRDQRSRAEEPGDGGPGEAVQFIAQMTADLAQLARRHRYDTLGFLLDMALMEAQETMARNAAKGDD